MRRPKIQPTRNKLDLTDRVQVRIVTRRLGVSQAELIALVGRIGNSITAISKEINLQRSSRLAASALPPAAVIASAAATEAAAPEKGAPAETPG
jgi:Protein of unknown function (DUF3606)